METIQVKILEGGKTAIEYTLATAFGDSLLFKDITPKQKFEIAQARKELRTFEIAEDQQKDYNKLWTEGNVLFAQIIDKDKQLIRII